jgi:hypothetical protein
VQNPDLPVHDATPATSKTVFAEDPDQLCTEVVVTDSQKPTRYHYLIQDTPGDSLICPWEKSLVPVVNTRIMVSMWLRFFVQ